MNSEPTFEPAGVFTLARMKLRVLRNQTRQVLDEAPLKVFATAAFITLIWLLLYELFRRILGYFRFDALQNAVAVSLLFNFFFLALLFMLTISNAILAYGALFAHEEAAYLLCTPLRPRSTVALKYAECLFFSNWSLLLLGMPLMLAIAQTQHESSLFYPLFMVCFLAFIPIPGAVGLLLAWFVGRFLPRTLRKLLVSVAGGILLLVIVWGLRSVRDMQPGNDHWLDGFFARMSLVESSILPSTWVTRGIEAAIDGRRDDAIRYVVVLIANAMFLSWLAVHIVSGGLSAAYDRATTSRGIVGRSAAAASGGVAGRIFFFLPHSARLIAAKDLRTFLRDPMQWSQLAILFGLMAMYLLNTPRFTLTETSNRWTAVMPFLNLSAISFILATFTSRFVFPLVSLEGHQLWLVGLFPISRGWILIAKFSFAMLVTVGVASCVTLLASYILQIGLFPSLIHWGVTVSICFGLCGFAVGIGARMPQFNQRNPARIANGLGGTINLVMSVVMIAAVLTGMGFVTWSVGENGLTPQSPPHLLAICGIAMLASVLSGAIAMIVGARHLTTIDL
jgi:ABC-2 type transport system permease protein